jgi:hypothetical protein
VRPLFDEQLSEALVKTLGDLFPDFLHIRLMNAGGAALIQGISPADDGE